MKKNLVLLTGIVFVLTILLAGGCNPGTSKKGSEEAGGSTLLEEKDPKNVDIFLKESLDSGTMHLFMSSDKKSECGVIDDYLVVVKPGYTIRWKNADDSEIFRIVKILPVGDSTFFGAVPVVETTDVDPTEVFGFSRGLHKLVIPDTAALDTLLKYEIHFEVRDHEDTTYIIDPYLKLPKQR